MDSIIKNTPLIVLFTGLLLSFTQSCAGQKDPQENIKNNAMIQKSEDEWKKVLSPEAYRITRLKGTERPFTGKYWNKFEKGEYVCVCCGSRLFSSDTKFESSCGWPSFFEKDPKANIRFSRDTSYGMIRTEVLCGTCGAHLGHIFDDGPAPTGKRYCINSEAMRFIPAGSEK